MVRWYNPGAQAIAQDEFSKCFMQKPRNSILSILLKGPLSLLGCFVRYFILFPYRLSLILAATCIFFATLPVVLALKDERLQVVLTETREHCSSTTAKLSLHHGVQIFADTAVSRALKCRIFLCLTILQSLTTLCSALTGFRMQLWPRNTVTWSNFRRNTRLLP
jgi:hypothetical protein